MTTGLLRADTAARFYLPPGQVYLKSHSVGCQPRRAEALLTRNLLAPWQQKGEAWPDWLSAIDDWRCALGRLLAVDPRDICPATNVTAALSRYLSALGTATPRRTIVMAPSAFPTIGFLAEGLAAEGWTTRYLDAEVDVRDARAWEAALCDDVALVIPMHVSSNSGARTDMAAVAKAAGAAGARCIADCAQSTGIVPVDPVGWGVDAIVGTSVKWLCGGPGAAFLWVAPHDRDKLAPSERGWWSHADPFEMDIGNFRYAPDARRWWGGTPDVAPFILSSAGIAEITAIGVDAIRAHNRALQAMFRGALEPSTPQWRWPGGDIGGTLCIDLGDDQRRVAALLEAAHVDVDFRGTVVRLSFHAYNGAADVETLVAALG